MVQEQCGQSLCGWQTIFLQYILTKVKHMLQNRKLQLKIAVELG